MNNHFECIVLGGGAAGSTIGHYLAALGHETVVLERTTRAHHKVCGEFVSFEALSYLSEMNIAVNQSPVIKLLKICSPRSSVEYPLPYAGRGISRYRLDEDLLANARRAGACVRRGVDVTNYRRDRPDRWLVETTEGDFFCPHLFVATGKHDCSKEHKRDDRDHGYVALKVHISSASFSERLQGTIALYTFPGGYGGLSPVEEGSNFCFIIKKDMFKSLKGAFKDVVKVLGRANHHLDSLLQDMDVKSADCALGYIPYGFLRTRKPDGIYFAGDQHAVIPSFCGDGIAMALSSGKSCAYEFHIRESGKGLFEKRTRRTRAQLQWALGAHAILNSPKMFEIFLAVAQRTPFVLNAVFNKTRTRSREEFSYETCACVKNMHPRS